MLGDNPKRTLINSDGQKLEIKKIFKTLQGEGLFAGQPAVFIRLGGCNLACKFCDTSFEDFETYSLDRIIDIVKTLSLNDVGLSVIKLVVITGGEPLRQNIEPCCQELIDLGFNVQIETNGTLYRNLPGQVHIVCSPKLSSNYKYVPLKIDLLTRLSAIKFLVSTTIKGYDKIAEIGQSKSNIPVYIQPIDQYNDKINKENTKLAINIALNTGYRVSTQLHKIWEIE